MEYNFRDIERRWQQWWKDNDIYKVSNPSTSPGQAPKPKYYVLDMFPYPSGAGLHVGHPLGYIASDIYARFKRLKGFNVLHPMGYDAFGLPAEQYAIEHGIHPAVSTENNINNFRKQLDNIGFSFDWSREVRTSDPKFYKWTQWIFLQLFKSFYNRNTRKAEPIDKLIAAFENDGNKDHPVPDAKFEERNPDFEMLDGKFSADQWNAFSEKTKQDILMEYRLAYCGYGEVNWCEALGTVLANDEVINGVSERGGYPVVKKKLRQWYLRITEYADRLLEGLLAVDFSESMKEMQTNWIGKSEGAEISFTLQASSHKLTVYTTRPDTIFGVDFMVIAPEHELVEQITTTEQKQAVEEYITYVKSRSERERMAEKKISGVFTGAYCIHPFSGKKIPVWISEYVLIGYGTGAIMAVPCGDERDHKFAKHFGLEITNIIGPHYNGEEANPTKDALLENSDFLDGIVMKDAIAVVLKKIEELGIGERKVNYKMRDAAFSRQRYWGEPFPIVWENGIAYPLDEEELPLELPHVENYKPGPEGEGPLANIPEWYLIPNPSPQAEKAKIGAANVPKYSVHSPSQYELARTMRKEHTEAEAVMWELLRNDQMGVKFRRQHPIENYIVDFISLQEKLVVEIDGGYHEGQDQKKYDEMRTKTLNEIGFKVLRFTNEEVLKNQYKVRDRIKEELALHTPSPLVERGQGVRETNTMPGYAGSSWYFLRYMDPHNKKEFCDRKISDYWGQVDLYIGGTEHAVGHLLYSRMWTKFLYDRGWIGYEEPYKRLVNQGMIQGSSRFVYRVISTSKSGMSSFPVPIFLSFKFYEKYLEYGYLSIETVNDFLNGRYSGDWKKPIDDKVPGVFSIAPSHVDVNIVDGVELDIEQFKKWRGGEYANAQIILEDGSLYQSGAESKYVCGTEIEKMSKSKFNVVNPDDLVNRYGADTFRMYEMFLGPVEMSKPWDTKGIEGVHRFLKKFWRLFADEERGLIITDEAATNEELKVLHKTIKKIEEDTERFSFNTGVSAFMIATNELTDLKCHKRSILEPLVILLAPYAPHVAEELWHLQGHKTSVVDGVYPTFEQKYVKESSKTYPVAINGKTRTELTIALDATQQQVEEIVLANEIVKKWMDGKSPKKVIYVKNKMVNVVV
jgi:leucyl-tRNA synthetase